MALESLRTPQKVLYFKTSFDFLSALNIKKENIMFEERKYTTTVPRNLIPSVKHRAGSIMVCACFAASGLVVIDGTMNSQL